MSDQSITSNTSLELSMSDLRDTFHDDTAGVSFSEYYLGSPRGLVEALDFQDPFEQSFETRCFARTNTQGNGTLSFSIQILDGTPGVPKGIYAIDKVAVPGGSLFMTLSAFGGVSYTYQVFIDSEPFTLAQFNALGGIGSQDETYYKIKFRPAINTTIPTEGNPISLSYFYGAQDLDGVGEYENGVFYFPSKTGEYPGHDTTFTPYKFEEYNLANELSTSSIYHDAKEGISKIVFVQPTGYYFFSDNPDVPAFLAEGLPDDIELELTFYGSVTGAGGNGGSATIDPNSLDRDGKNGGDGVVINHPGPLTTVHFGPPPGARAGGTAQRVIAGGGGGGAAGWFKRFNDNEVNRLSGVFGSGGGGGAGGGGGGTALARSTFTFDKPRRIRGFGAVQNTDRGTRPSGPGSEKDHHRSGKPVMLDNHNIIGVAPRAGGHGGCLVENYWEPDVVFDDTGQSYNQNSTYISRIQSGIGQGSTASTTVVYNGSVIKSSSSYNARSGRCGDGGQQSPPSPVFSEFGNFSSVITRGADPDYYYHAPPFYYGEGSVHSISSGETRYNVYRYKFAGADVKDLVSDDWSSAPDDDKPNDFHLSHIYVQSGASGGWVTDKDENWSAGFGPSSIGRSNFWNPMFYDRVQEDDVNEPGLSAGGYGGSHGFPQAVTRLRESGGAVDLRSGGIAGQYEPENLPGQSASEGGNHYPITGAGGGGGGWGGNGGAAQGFDYSTNTSVRTAVGGFGGYAFRWNDGTIFTTTLPESIFGSKPDTRSR